MLPSSRTRKTLARDCFDIQSNSFALIMEPPTRTIRRMEDERVSSNKLDPMRLSTPRKMHSELVFSADSDVIIEIQSLIQGICSCVHIHRRSVASLTDLSSPTIITTDHIRHSRFTHLFSWETTPPETRKKLSSELCLV